MKDLKEQRVWVKFCFKYGKNVYGEFSDVATWLWRGLFETYGNVKSDTGVSKRAERPSKVTPNMDGLPRQWTTITLRKCLRQFVKIVAQLSVRLPKKQESVNVRST